MGYNETILFNPVPSGRTLDIDNRKNLFKCIISLMEQTELLLVQVQFNGENAMFETGHRIFEIFLE
jgi:hypothetical protein